MTDQPARTLIRGGRVYDHDGDVHQPAVADLLIANGKIERARLKATAVSVVGEPAKPSAPGVTPA